MGFFDFFKNMFKKQNCTFCGKECGLLGRDKLKDGEYICNACQHGVSRHIRVSRFTKEELAGHMEYMKQSDRIFKEVIGGVEKGKCIPHPTNFQTFQFFDDHGMFIIRERKYDSDPTYPVELFRYDQLAGYEPYLEERDASEPGKPKEFVEGGIKLTFVGGEGLSSEVKAGASAHPYITDTVKVCLGKGTSGKDNMRYVENIMGHFDFIFGVHDDRKGLFGFGMSKEEKRNLQGGVAMVNSFIDAVKIAKAGQTELTEEQKAEFEKNKNLMQDAQTGGLAVYTRRADEAWGKIQ